MTGSGRSGGLADAGKKGFQASVGKAIYEEDSESDAEASVLGREGRGEEGPLGRPGGES